MTKPTETITELGRSSTFYACTNSKPLLDWGEFAGVAFECELPDGVVA